MPYHYQTTSSSHVRSAGSLKSIILNISVFLFCVLTLGSIEVKGSVAEQFGLRVGGGDVSRKPAPFTPYPQTTSKLADSIQRPQVAGNHATSE